MNHKDKYLTCNLKWGDFESEYYIMLNAVYRLKELLENRYGNLCKASKMLGFHKTYLTKQLSSLCACPRAMTVDKICKHLDTSINYVILGFGEQQYTDCSGTFNNFIRLYREKYSGKHHRSLDVAVYALIKGAKKNLPMKFLIRVAREQHVTIDWLIGG